MNAPNSQRRVLATGKVTFNDDYTEVKDIQMTQRDDAPPQRFTKKPVTIEAVQFTQTMLEAHLFDGVPLPVGLSCGSASFHPGDRKIWSANIYIETLESHGDSHKVSVGDWIITGIKGEKYACKPDIFAATYEPEGTRLSETAAFHVPQGMKCVPTKPTPRMLEVCGPITGYDGESPDKDHCAWYTAMIEAAPTLSYAASPKGSDPELASDLEHLAKSMTDPDYSASSGDIITIRCAVEELRRHDKHGEGITWSEDPGLGLSIAKKPLSVRLRQISNQWINLGEKQTLMLENLIISAEWLEARLSASATLQVPAGMKCVPTKPTPRMLEVCGPITGYDGESPDKDHCAWYTAMIEAAPTLPYARTEVEHAEGYPGIAHDFEKMRMECEAYKNALMAAVQIIAKHDPAGAKRWLAELERGDGPKERDK